jgi:hypothetical protein
MVFLIANICADPFYLRFAQGKSLVCSLPFEKYVRSNLVCNHMRAGAFHFFYQVGDGDCGMKLDQNMHVIRHPANLHKIAPHFTALNRDGRIYSVLDLWG